MPPPPPALFVASFVVGAAEADSAFRAVARGDNDPDAAVVADVVVPLAAAAAAVVAADGVLSFLTISRHSGQTYSTPPVLRPHFFVALFTLHRAHSRADFDSFGFDAAAVPPPLTPSAAVLVSSVLFVAPLSRGEIGGELITWQQ